jgi:putative cell wall-binding protein
VTVLVGGAASALTVDATDTAVVPAVAVVPTSVFAGSSSAAGGNESFTITNTFNATDVVEYIVAPPTSTNIISSGTDLQCSASPFETVAFASVPTVTVTPGSGNVGTTDVAPVITASLSHNAAADTATGCSSLTDVVKLTFANSSAVGSTAGDTYTVTLSGLTYNIGAATPAGALVVVAQGENFSESALTSYGTGTGNYHATASAAFPALSDANVFLKVNATATANTPTVQLNVGQAGTVSPVVITEGAAAALTGETWICVVPIGWTFTAATGTGTAAPAATPGAGTVVTAAATTIAASASINIAASSTVATTYTITGLGAATTPTAAGPAAAEILVDTTSGCATAPKVVSLATVIFNVQPGTSQVVFGADADGTAAVELANAFPYTGGHTGVANVVLATDSNFPDALAASYLASNLNTGILLTPTNTISSETFQAICNEGVTTVYVAGGPLAISTGDITELEGTKACLFGGVTLAATNLTVVQLFGQTQYDTAQILAEFPGVLAVGSINISGAYTGVYNDTTGKSTAAPASAVLKTAIVVTGTNFQDASAASVTAYNDKFPVILTNPTSLSSQAASTLTSLGIRQVLLIGGPLAVSDTVEGQIAALGPAVLRIAGTDYTDTSQLLAQFELNVNTTASTGTYLGLGWALGVNSAGTNWGGQVFAARGDFFADALSGASVGKIGPHFYPLLEIENPNTVGTYVTTFLNTGGNAAVGGIDALGASGRISVINVLGGPLAVTFPTTQAMQAAVAAG